MTTRLTFLGGAGTVTGSKMLVEHGGHRVLVDCGLFQGLRELRRRNWAPLPVEPASIDAVVLSHAHLDHCGYLPALVQQGFSGPVFCTAGTAELAAIVLRDSARLAEEEARDARGGGWSRHAEPRPLYDEQDVARTLELLTVLEPGAPPAGTGPAGDGTAPTGPAGDGPGPTGPARGSVVPPVAGPVEVAPGITVTLPSAGHILGSASPVVRAGDDVLAFSGDLGRRGHPLLLPPGGPPAADAVVVESTYGDRRHPEPDSRPLADALRRTFARGGVVVIPAFAVDRTEAVLMALGRLMRSGEVPSVPVFVDSPMALAALRVYRQALAAADPELRPDVVRAARAGHDPFDPGDLREATSAEESRRLNRPQMPCVLVSASGMASGGRVVHHLAQLLPDRRVTVLLVGYQAAGTRGRALAEGARQVKIHGCYVPVRAEIVQLDEFSVHADVDDLLAWLGSAPAAPRVCYVVHGEEGASEALAERIRDELDWCAVVPRPQERVLVRGTPRA